MRSCQLPLKKHMLLITLILSAIKKIVNLYYTNSPKVAYYFREFFTNLDFMPAVTFPKTVIWIIMHIKSYLDFTERGLLQ